MRMGEPEYASQRHIRHAFLLRRATPRSRAWRRSRGTPIRRDEQAGGVATRCSRNPGVRESPEPGDTTFLSRAASAELLSGPSAGGLTDQVVALGDVGRAPGGLGIRRGGSGHIAVELVQVGADG